MSARQHIPPMDHVRKVRKRIERLRALGVEDEIMEGDRPRRRVLKEWTMLRKQIDLDIDRILAGLLGEWEPPLADYADEDPEGSWLAP